MLNLPNVTLVCIDCKHYDASVSAFYSCLSQVNFGESIFLSDRKTELIIGRSELIPKIKTIQEYSNFCIKELYKWINTAHLLIIQHDGFIMNVGSWENCFLDYDYIGAPWPHPKNNVGNGGFSLRSLRLQKIISHDPDFSGIHPEDGVICSRNRRMLEEKHNIRFAPLEIASKFSCEYKWNEFSFGFHNKRYINQAKRKIQHIDSLQKQINNKLCSISKIVPVA